MPNLWHARAEVSYLQGAFNRHGYTVESSNRNFNFSVFLLLALPGPVPPSTVSKSFFGGPPCKAEHSFCVMNVMLQQHLQLKSHNIHCEKKNSGSGRQWKGRQTNAIHPCVACDPDISMEV